MVRHTFDPDELFRPNLKAPPDFKQLSNDSCSYLYFSWLFSGAVCTLLSGSAVSEQISYNRHARPVWTVPVFAGCSTTRRVSPSLFS